jgi:alpha-ribazole phosphatase/probable phosphoglycerate mutase
MLLIRHAETDLAGTFCGHIDPPLNQKGQRQVRELLDALSSVKMDAIYSSDLLRAATTAGALAESRFLPCHLRASLREIHFGDWEGLTWSAIQERDEKFAQEWSFSFPDISPPGGETFASFEKRVIQEVDLLRNQIENCIAIVTHGGVLRLILEKMASIPSKDAWSLTHSYCCVLRLNEDNAADTWTLQTTIIS